MSAFINGIGLISPQKTDAPRRFPDEVGAFESDYLKCIEPASYKPFIDPLQSRRMCRMIKMGIASARMCLIDAGCEMPDAIITGTGLGSVEDTEKILDTIHLDQLFLNPTPFMQSTYNTISSQIAIQLKCHNYNSTYVHRIFSFESTLKDALLQLSEGSSLQVLAGGVDEMTMNHLMITRRAGHWKQGPVRNLEMLKWNTPGSIAGEGAGYFLISKDKGDKSYSELKGVSTLYKPRNKEEILSHLETFLSSFSLKFNDIDLVLTGINGDNRVDHLYYELKALAFPSTPLSYYKHLCGEYHTSSGFALWLASVILKNQNLPEIILISGNQPARIRNILICNQYYNANHSFILVSKA